MSNTEESSDDLINFNAPPSPSILSSRVSEPELDNVSENLLDTELPEFEQKLQTSSQVSATHSRCSSVDIEDILISIDDDYEAPQRPGPSKEPNHFFEEICLQDLNGGCSTSDEDELEKDNFEALRILDSLDEILNAHLNDEGCDDDCDCFDSVTQQSIEECLTELDDYLKSLDSCFDTDEEECGDEAVDGHCESRNSTKRTWPSQEESLPVTPSRTDSRASLRIKLRKIEENYAKYLSLGKTNRCYQLNERSREDIRFRSLTPSCRRKQALKEARSQCVNALATLPNKRRRRSELLRSSLVEKSGNSSDTTEVKDVQTERLAHASGECYTGTVVVEAHREASSRSSSPVDVFSDGDRDVRDVMAGPGPKDGAGGQVRTWLRSSMRQLRHLRLPSDSEPVRTSREGTLPESPAAPPPAVTLVNEPPSDPLEVIPSGARPFSAPSRLSRSGISGVASDETSPTQSQYQLSRDSAVSPEPGGQGGRSSSLSSASRRQRSLSSSDSSLASSLETAGTTPGVRPQQRGQNAAIDSRRPCERPRRTDMPEASSPLGQWPHSLSSTLACLSCTLGLFNISRFAILTIHFGSNFIFQFMILSIFFGLPLYTLQMCLGQQLGAGVIDMWRISPLFQGVGVSLLISNALVGIYSIVGVSWMFVFFRDSFIARADNYKWAEPFIYYRNAYQTSLNASQKLHPGTVADYFNTVVLQRQHLETGNEYGTIKFQMAFNLAVVWMIIFVSLSKGLKSYGKVIHVFVLVPVFGMFIVSAKIMGLMPPNFIDNMLPESAWDEFFLNSRSWLAAAQETFLTWGLLGAAVMQITSHNKEKRQLQRDASLVAIITFIILFLVALLANSCVQILRAAGFYYVPSSFENNNSYTFLRLQTDPLPTTLGNTPIRYMIHNSFILGEKVVRPFMDPTKESGYQVLRLATELIPATFAVLGPEKISSFWAVFCFFIFILFGIAQQLAIWHCVITGIMAIKANVLKNWETTITFFSCCFGFLLGLPMATELGIYVVYVLDYTIGGTWWLLTIIFLQIVAVFMVRGRPYSGDNIVLALFNSNGHSCIYSWLPLLLTFIWNVILPVALVVLCISTFKNGHFKEMFIWHHAPVAEYWPLIVRQIGSMIQLLPILCVPIVAVIQSYRYLNNGPSDILDRIQLLYRPPIGDHMDELAIQEAVAAARMNNQITTMLADDPPPKYTPPPSYTTATGVRIAKFLRQSIRRSVRRLANVLGESSNTRTRAPISQTQLPPPDYNAVLVEMGQSSAITDVPITVIDVPAPSNNVRLSTLERLRTLQPPQGSSVITAAEVACILRSSFRRSTVRRNRVGEDLEAQFTDNSIASLSAENLIDSAAPIGETSLVLDHLPDTFEENEDKITTVI